MTPTSNRIDEEAAQWAVRLATGILPEEDELALEAWRAADPRHQGAFIRARAVSLDLKRLSALSPLSPCGRGAGVRGHKRLFLATAATLSALSIIVTAVWLAHRTGTETYVTAIGEMRRVTLTDGSSILLNTASQVQVSFDERLREVRLAKGEALFEVEKDPARPFIVRANDVAVRAIGTAFSVRLAEGRVDVTVTEGVVEVAQPSAVRPIIRRVTAHQGARVSSAGPPEVRPLGADVTERRLAWREGMVAFSGEPLAEAVAEVNRHNRRHIVVDDPALAAQPMVGIFRATDIEGFAQTAATALGAEAVHDGDVIRIRRRAPL